MAAKESGWTSEIRALFKDFPVSDEDVESVIKQVIENNTTNIKDEVILYERARKRLFYIMSKKDYIYKKKKVR